MTLELSEQQQKLFNEYYDYAIRIAKRDKYNTFVQIDDKVQEAIIVLCRCAKQWNDSKGVKFSTYLTTAIFNKMKQLYRYSAYKQTEYLSLDRYDNDHWEENEDILHIDNNDSVETLLRLLNHHDFSQFDRELMYHTFGLKNRPQLSLKKFMDKYANLYRAKSYQTLCSQDYVGTILLKWRQKINEAKITC